MGGSGTTTALASLALSLAAVHGPDELHLYALDFGGGELCPLTELPHTGAVITATETERQLRLLRFLTAELDRRRGLGAARAHEPRIVVLLDGYGTFRNAFDDPATASSVDEVTRVFAEGPELGVLAVASADRVGGLPTALAATVAQRWLFRLADPYDYGVFGLAPRSVPSLPPGRAIVAGSGQLMQIGRPAPGIAEAAARLAAAVPAPRRAPQQLGTLPRQVGPDDLPDGAHLDQETWLLPVGIADHDLRPAVMRLHPGEHFLLAGPARSGKSSGLLALARLVRCATADVRLTAVTVRPSPLARSPDLDRVVADPAELTEVLAAINDDPRPQLLLIDDADFVDDPDHAIDRLLRCRRADLHVIAAGRADLLRSAYGHWTGAVRRSRSGVLLKPDTDLDGELLGVRLPRRAPVAVTAARGWLVHDGGVAFVQLATVLT